MFCRLLEVVELLSMLKVVPMKRFLLHLVSLHSQLIRALNSSGHLLEVEGIRLLAQLVRASSSPESSASGKSYPILNQFS